jgi:SAM-dependent methyltransferase
MVASYHSYSRQYSRNALRGVDIEPRPPLAMNIALEYAGVIKHLLDIGCGTAEKMLTLMNAFNTVTGVEPSMPLVAVAKKNIQSKQLNNAFLIRGVSQNLPFNSDSFDVVTAILTWEDPKEAHRVIKPNGTLIVEALGPEDKAEFTIHFGKDADGYRGARLDVNLEQLKNKINDKWAPYFSQIEFFNQKWRTSYTKKGLWDLLTTTYSTVRNFDPKTDKPLFDKAIKSLEKEGEMVLTQNRLLMVAQGKK